MIKRLLIFVLSTVFIFRCVDLVDATEIIPSDFNIDGKVDVFDYNRLATHYGYVGDTTAMNEDINRDGKVDSSDLTIFLPNFNKSSNPIPEFAITEQVRNVKEYFNDDAYKMDAEVTPWSLENGSLGGDHLYLISTYDTFLCSIAKNIFSLTSWDNLSKTNNCKLRQTSSMTPFKIPVSDDPLWKRDFYGSFSGHILLTKNSGAMLYLFNHGEILNNDYQLPNQPCKMAPDIGYGTMPCDPKNRDKSYNAFITMSSFPFTLANYTSQNLFIDNGPIVWPANGYVENVNGVNKKATDLGILHPSSIVKDNFVYVYYRDTSLGADNDGRGPGLKVARAPIQNFGIDPLSFKTFFNEKFSDSALPVGFDKNQIRNFFSQKGGRSSSLFINENVITAKGAKIPKTFSFSVAKIKGTNFYLGVSNDLSLGVTIRISNDLIHWSDPTTVLSTADFFKGGVDLTRDTLLYARLANKNGDSNNEIDPGEFYIIGVQKGPSPYDASRTVNLVKSVKLKLLNILVN